MDKQISILILIFKWGPQGKLNSLPWSSILTDFQNQKYRISIPKFRAQLVEKWEEHKQFQSVMRFTQIQQKEEKVAHKIEM